MKNTVRSVVVALAIAASSLMGAGAASATPVDTPTDFDWIAGPTIPGTIVAKQRGDVFVAELANRDPNSGGICWHAIWIAEAQGPICVTRFAYDRYQVGDSWHGAGFKRDW